MIGNTCAEWGTKFSRWPPILKPLHLKSGSHTRIDSLHDSQLATWDMFLNQFNGQKLHVELEVAPTGPHTLIFMRWASMRVDMCFVFWHWHFSGAHPNNSIDGHQLMPTAPCRGDGIECGGQVARTRRGEGKYLLKVELHLLEFQGAPFSLSQIYWEYTLNSVVSHLWQPKCTWYYGVL